MVTTPQITKRKELIKLLKMPNGTGKSILIERLGWQAHSIRSAISDLRKQGFIILRTTSKKCGQSIYAITAEPQYVAIGKTDDVDQVLTGGSPDNPTGGPIDVQPNNQINNKAVIEPNIQDTREGA